MPPIRGALFLPTSRKEVINSCVFFVYVTRSLPHLWIGFVHLFSWKDGTSVATVLFKFEENIVPIRISKKGMKLVYWISPPFRLPYVINMAHKCNSMKINRCRDPELFRCWNWQNLKSDFPFFILLILRNCQLLYTTCVPTNIRLANTSVRFLFASVSMENI